MYMKIQWIILSLLLLMSLMSACTSVDARPTSPSPLPFNASTPSCLIPARLGKQKLQVELALSQEAQQQGLMYRWNLPPDQGMLFIFKSEQKLGFWMKNTYLPLSIAFLNDALEIVDIQDMQPLDETIHFSRKPARYALEMNQGWFSRHQITTGMRLEITLPSTCR